MRRIARFTRAPERMRARLHVPFPRGGILH